MTKTKKQLRAEAVERLKNTAHWLMCFYADGEAVYWHSGYQPERESVGQSMLKDIELLTDDPNDDSAPEKVVSGGAANVTTESCDSREKLEADVRRSLGFTVDDVFHWLDRQAAITEREQQAKVDELTGQLEQSRKLIGDMLDAADAIRLLGGSYGD